MLSKLNNLCMKMCEYESGEAKRIQHFIKVHAFSKLIAEMEGIDSDTALILEAAAYVHDIGIKPSLVKYGDCEGKHQEQEGIIPAKTMLSGLGFSEEITDRVCFLVAHHHTYKDVKGHDWQILLEADFLVNSMENNMNKSAITKAEEAFFVTATGKKLLETMFDL